MKKYLLFTVVLLFIDCGSEKAQMGVPPKKKEMCTVTKNDINTSIICPDGTYAEIYNGSQGPKGDTGSPGVNGAAGPQGPQGQEGSVGPQGPQGNPGQNGLNGLDSTPVTIQPFCPSLLGSFQEQYMTLGGNLYAIYYGGGYVFLALLHAGSYVTTDGRNCHFTVTADNHIVY